MRPPDGPAPRRRGRPRDPSIDAAIFEATLELLAEGGYAKATIEAVAGRARLQRPAVYRRFPSRSALAAAAVRAALAHANPTAPETDDPAQDLTAVLRNLIRELTTTPLGAAIKGVVSFLEHDAELRAAALALQKDRGRLLHATLARMRARGRLRPGLDVPTAIDVLLGGVYFRLMFSERKLAPAFARVLVRLVTTQG